METTQAIHPRDKTNHTRHTEQQTQKEKKKKRDAHNWSTFPQKFWWPKTSPPTPSRFTNLFSSSSQLKFLPPQHAQIFVSHWLLRVFCFCNEISISKFFGLFLLPFPEAGKAIIKLEEQLAEFKQQEKKAVVEMKGPGKGRPKSLAFEHQVRTILESGCSARAAQDHVLSSARVYLTSAAFAEYEQHVPTKRWSYPSTPDPNPTSAPKQYFYPSSSQHPQHRFQAVPA
jgi:hypothetical protein